MENYLIHLLYLHGGEGPYFPGCIPPGDTVSSESVVGVIPGHSGVMIGCVNI